MVQFQSIGVIGAGAWGTALAQTAAHSGREVTLWAYETEVAEAINLGELIPDLEQGDEL